MMTRPDETPGATCPFCTLLCTDLPQTSISDPDALACPRARGAFARVAAEGGGHSARVNGAAADLDTAVAAAAALLRDAGRPLFAGAGGDVGALRALLDLGAACGATVDHLHGEAMARGLRIFQSEGWMSASFGELRRRADLVVVLDGGVLERYPRLAERFIAGARAAGHAGQRRPLALITIGGKRPQLPAEIEAEHVDCPLEDLADALGLLRTLQHDRPIPNAAAPPVAIATLGALLTRLRSARYGVMVWSADSFDFEHGDLTVGAAAGLVGELNAATRFTGLPIAAPDGGASLQQVAGWKCGFPLRMAFRTGGPVYDLYHHGAERMLARGDADLLLWLSAFAAHPLPPTETPTVVLGRPDDPAGARASVFIPVGVPGLDHEGYLFRGDGAVAVPAGRMRALGLPAAATVLRAMHDRLEAAD